VTYERPFGDLTVLAGLRVEDVKIDLDQATRGQRDENDYTKLYPSLHLGWKLDDDQQLTASYSHRVQRPNPLQFNTFPLFVDPLNLRSGNARLKPQETHSYELGYEYRASPTVYLATLYYRQNVNGFADVVRELPGGLFLTTTENISRSRSAGVELVANGKLGKSVTYNLSTDLYWTEIEPQPLGSPETRSAYGASGRGNLTWQATANDLVQLNGFLNGKRLNPQGYIEPMGGLNLGYRHKFNDRFAFVLTVQDLLHSFRFRQVFDTPTFKGRLKSDFDSRQFQAGFTWTLGGGRRPDPGFDFNAGAGGPPP
jgi:outer membrane receptor protein involved in Fe transport